VKEREGEGERDLDCGQQTEKNVTRKKIEKEKKKLKRDNYSQELTV